MERIEGRTNRASLAAGAGRGVGVQVDKEGGCGNSFEDVVSQRRLNARPRTVAAELRWRASRARSQLGAPDYPKGPIQVVVSAGESPSPAG